MITLRNRMPRTLGDGVKLACAAALGRDAFEVAMKLPNGVSERVSVYWGRRAWPISVLGRTVAGKELVFVHIPKCAETSIARAFGRHEIGHYPAFMLRGADPARWRQAVKFTVVREPVERLRSAIVHFAKSEFANRHERAIAHKAGLPDAWNEVLEDVLLSKYRWRQFFAGTGPGRSGFTVPQVDWLRCGNRIVVDRVYSIERLGDLEQWLSELVDSEVRLRVANQSNWVTTKSLVADDRLRELVYGRYRRDVELWRNIQREGGVLFGNSSV